jgi:hypothetical protein
MWDLLRRLIGIGPSDAEAARRMDEKMSRGLERVRRVIYGAIALGVLLLVGTWVALFLAG